MNNYEETTILTPIHVVVDIVNDYVMSLIPCEKNEYLNSNSIVLFDENSVV